MRSKRKTEIDDVCFDWRRAAEERRARKEEATARRLATAARHGTLSRKPKPLGERKPAAFYVSPNIERSWFDDDEHWWSASYFLNSVRWREITWRANGEGFSQLHYRI